MIWHSQQVTDNHVTNMMTWHLGCETDNHKIDNHVIVIDAMAWYK